MTDVALETDVLVLGGGPAGAWAALAAARAGARVVLADKGYCGTSGPTASGGNNLWNIAPGPGRDESVRTRLQQGGHLSDPEWMYRVLDETHRRVDELAEWGYPFPTRPDGTSARTSLQGPEYMRRMRRKVHRSGVRILDHSPALQLLTDSDGVVSGASGVQRQNDFHDWTVKAGAVVIATGGCAFLSGSFGTDVDTGDGHLMAAEAGADFSGMEFSGQYALAPAWSGHTKGLMMQFATYYDAAGKPLGENGFSGREQVFAALAAGHRVYARLDKALSENRTAMRQSQPNYFLPLDKAGIDPFTQKYPLRAVLEGTVRGSGGIRITDSECATAVPGLYAAGDAATRELITGAVSGGGSHNGAWAMSSGNFAGGGAARFARARGSVGAATPVPGAGLRESTVGAVGARAVIGLVQEHTLPLRRSYFRSQESLQDSATELDSVWSGVADRLGGSGRELLRARQSAALLAVARWTTHSALTRTESRGMHRRTDHPGTAANWTHRLVSGGLDAVTVAADVAAAPAAVAS